MQSDNNRLDSTNIDSILCFPRNDTNSIADAALEGKPWIRFGARSIDIALVSFVLFILLLIFNPSTSANFNHTFVIDSILYMLTLFIWIFIESILLCTWGSTPGKRLFKITLRDANGKKPTLFKALKRSFKVWIIGLGAGIPILSFFAEIFSYCDLSTDGITKWDKTENFTVRHEKIGFIRLLVAFFILFGPYLLCKMSSIFII